MATVNELVTILSYKLGAGTKESLASFSEGIEKVKDGLSKLSAFAFATQSALYAFTGMAARRSLQLENMSKTTGMAADSLQKYQYAAERIGVSSEAVTNDLAMLYETMTSPIPGELNQQLLMLGIAVKDVATNSIRPVTDIFSDLAETLKGMGEQEALQWGKKLGLSNDSIILLRQGKIGIQKLMREAEEMGAIIPEDQIRSGAELNRQLDANLFTLEQIGSQIGLAIAPALNEVVYSFSQWLKDNKEWIALNLQNLIEGIGKGFSDFFDILKTGAEFISPLLEQFGLMKDGLIDVETTATAVKYALLALAGAKVLGAISTVISFISGIIGAAKGAAAAVGGIAGAAVGGIAGAAAVGIAGAAGIANEVYQTVKNPDRVQENVDMKGWTIWDAINPFKAISKQAGESIQTLAGWFEPSMDERLENARQELKGRDFSRNTINNSNSSSVTTNNNQKTINISGLTTGQMDILRNDIRQIPTSQVNNPGSFGAFNQAG